MKQRDFDLLAITAIFAAYSVTIRLALRLDLVGSLLGGAANTIPLVIFGLVVRRIVERQLIGKSALIQLAAHLVMCATFASLSYLILIVLLGLFYGMRPDGFVVQPFSVSATAWQSLENVTTYALIVAVSYMQATKKVSTASHHEVSEKRTDPALHVATHIPSQLGAETRADPALSRYFIRIGEELRPLDMDTVVSIGGADDYAEVRTAVGKHLVRVTLAEFAKSLDPAKYVRVHRSWIVNTHRIARAEHAGGGRLLLHMETGQTISTSRVGAKLLRDRVL
jgi:DNA-binding LytR/AlgR family response regulator